MGTPPIRYALTRDGYQLAYYVAGSGAPLVVNLPPTASHLELERRSPQFSGLFDALAERGRLVRFDHRGTGLSQRDVEDMSPDAMAEDFAAVIDAAGLDAVALVAWGAAAWAAVAFAATAPDRVERLVLWDPPPPRAEAVREVPRWEAMVPLLDADWEAYTESLMLLQRIDPTDVPRMARWIRMCTTAEDFRRLTIATLTHDVAPHFPNVRSETTVLVTRQGPGVAGPEYVRSISGAGLVSRQGVLGHYPWCLPNDEILAVLEEIGALPPEAPPDTTATTGLRVILVTDLVDHTQLFDHLGDEEGRRILREHERVTRSALADHGGHEVKTMGDGFLAWFGSAQRALACAAEIHRATDALGSVRVRIGINAGEPVAEHDDLFGTSVVTASRVAALATGGQTLVTGVVRDLAAGKGFVFTGGDEHRLKGLEEPVRVWAVVGLDGQGA